MTSRIPILLSLLLCMSAAAHATPPVETATVEQVTAFRRACRRLASKASLMSVMGKDGWLFMDNELQHLAAGEFWGKAARRTGRARRVSKRDPLPVILDTQRQFSEMGVRLILLPIPAKAVIYPEAAWPDAPKDKAGRHLRLDPDHQRFYALLREKGVEVLDFSDFLLQERSTKKPALYCRHDTHFSGRAARVLAGALAPHLKAIPPDATLKDKLKRQTNQVQIQGDLFQTWKLRIPKSKRPEPERLQLSFVLRPGPEGSGVPLEEDRNSPLLIFGDSHGLVFHVGGDMHAKGAGLADHLAFELGRAVDVACVRGESATQSRLILRRRQKGSPGYLEGKKIAIWILTVREFTDGDWMKVPLGGKP